MFIPEKTKTVLHDFDKFRQNASNHLNGQGLPIEEARKFVPPWVYKTKQLFPPFTYFGGKRGIAAEVWRRFGSDIPNYIEPFAGGLSVLLARPIFDLRNLKKYRELVNDTNLFLLNFWRAVQQKNIEHLIRISDFGAHERELLDRRAALLQGAYELAGKMKTVDYCDDELAAYWLYVQRQWIGGGADDVNSVPKKKMIRAKESGFLGDSLEEHLRFLQARMRHVRCFSGDGVSLLNDEDEWLRPLQSPTQTINIGGVAGVFMDTPYLGTTHYYSGRLDERDPANQVPLAAREWALKYGKYPQFRICFCGYLHHHEGFFPEGGKNGWIKIPWKKANGYSTPGAGKIEQIETVWFSPHCNRFPGDPN